MATETHKYMVFCSIIYIIEVFSSGVKTKTPIQRATHLADDAAVVSTSVRMDGVRTRWRRIEEAGKRRSREFVPAPLSPRGSRRANACFFVTRKRGRGRVIASFESCEVRSHKLQKSKRGKEKNLNRRAEKNVSRAEKRHDIWRKFDCSYRVFYSYSEYKQKSSW